MKCFSNIIVATLISLIAGSAALADPAIAINTKNSEQIDSDKITSVLVGKRKFWDNGAEVVIAILKGNPNASKALEKHAKMDEGRFKNHWQRLAFSGRGRMPKFFSSTDMTDRETEMFIFITPHIIADPNDELERMQREEMCRRYKDPQLTFASTTPQSLTDRK